MEALHLKLASLVTSDRRQIVAGGFYGGQQNLDEVHQQRHQRGVRQNG